MNTPDEKKIALFLSQKATLDTFLARGAITQAQYKKSLGDLVRLMHMEAEIDEGLKAFLAQA